MPVSDMKFKFTIQPYQTEAVESEANVFAELPGAFHRPDYRPARSSRFSIIS